MKLQKGRFPGRGKPPFFFAPFSGKNLRESDLRKKVNRLRRKAVPIASSREGYFYASNAAELYSTIRQLKEMRAGLDAAICGLEQAMEKFAEKPDGGGRDR